MLKVWGRRSSSNVEALLWCLEELNLGYERIDAGFIYGVVDTPEYLAMNPNGTVPTLQDGDGPPLWETGAILRYIAGAYSRPEVIFGVAPEGCTFRFERVTFRHLGGQGRGS